MRPHRPVRAALLALALATAGCATESWSDPAVGAPFVPAPARVRELGALFEDASPTLHTAGSVSACPLGDRTVWALTDAGRGRGPRALPVEALAFLATAARDWPASDGLARFADAPAPPGAGLRFTPLAAAPAPGGAAFFVAAVPVAPGGGGAQGIALLTFDGRAPHVTPLFDAAAPAFGSAVVHAAGEGGGGPDLVFGVRADARRHHAYLARVAHGAEGDRAAYSFLAAEERWSDDVADAAPLFRAGPGALSVSWNGYLNGWLAVYAWPLPGFGGERPRIRVLARSARRPEGPWSPETTLFEVDGGRADGASPLGHGARELPHLAEDRGRVIVICVDGDASEGGGTPRAPTLWRVELPVIR